MSESFIAGIGYFATSLFFVSYFLRSDKQIFAVQTLAALTWLSYGILRQDMPVIVANVLVASSAAFKFVRLSLKAKAG